LNSNNSTYNPVNNQNTSTNQQPATVNNSIIWAMKFSSCGKLLASAGKDQIIRIWVLKSYYDYFNELTKNKKDSLVFNFKEEYARVRINGKWGLIDKTNNYYINAIYDEMNDSEEGFYFIELENNIGMMDYNGNIIHNPSFQEVS